MSAAEKLKALPIKSYSVTRDGLVVLDVRPEVWPQIVAVVEDVEITIQTLGPMGVHLEGLKESLAALDEALT